MSSWALFAYSVIAGIIAIACAVVIKLFKDKLKGNAAVLGSIEAVFFVSVIVYIVLFIMILCKK